MTEPMGYKQLLNNCAEQYEKVRVLLETEGKNDPDDVPYKSKYTAKEILSAMKNDLIKAEDNANSATDAIFIQRIESIIAAINYLLGVISIETEELSTGDEHLMKCLEILEGRELTKECIMIVLRCLNQLGILWSLRSEHEKSVEYLERAERLCKKYRTEVGATPLDPRDLFVMEQDYQDGMSVALESNWKTYEKIFTHTLYYLAQVYSSLDKSVQAAMYCHTTLRRQLESKEFDPIDWAINSATLSQFFIAQNNFGDGRHHLACATHVLDNYEMELQSRELKSEEYDELQEGVRRGRADIARCWAKYSLVLLLVSWDDLVRQANEETSADASGVQPAEENTNTVDAPDELVFNHDLVDHNERAAFLPSQDSVSDKPHMIFKSLEVTTIEDQITTKLVFDFDQARPVFLNAQKWLNLSKEYYSFSDHASDHIQIIQDTSKLYKVLAKFESSEDRQCKMHKRRIDMLELILTELNPQYYLNEIRQLHFELGETFCEIMDLKLALFQESEARRSAHAVNKINRLAMQSIKQFQAFINTLLDINEKLPEEFPVDLVRPTLLAHFYIGRLISKIITDDTEMKINNLRKSILNYNFLINYCQKHPSALPAIQTEIEVSKEIVQLLYVKMEKIASGVSI